MIDKDDIEITKNNAIIIAGFFILLLGFVFVLSIINIPFIGESPETISAQDSVDIYETDDQVILRLDNDINPDNIEISVGDDNYNWDDGEIIFEKEELLDNINIESYSDGNLYDTYEYNPQGESIDIVSSDDTILRGSEYDFSVEAQSASQNDLESIIWEMDGEFIDRDTPIIREEFNSTGTYNISVNLEINDVMYTSTKEIRVIEPDEVVLDMDVDKTDVTILEELNFNVTEVSDENVENYQWYFDDETSDTGEEVKHWYQEPGEYNVTVQGESEDTGESGQDSMIINVTELDESVETYQYTVNVYQAGTSDRLDDANVSLNNAITEQTDDGRVQFQVQAGEYELTVDKSGYESITENVEITENGVNDIRLSEELEDEDEQDSDEEGQESDEEELDAEDEDSSGANFSQQDSDEEESEPEGLNLILDNMDGEGSSDNPYVITSASELQAIEAEPTASYILGNNINASQTQTWNIVDDVDSELIGFSNETEFETNYMPIIEDSENVIVNDETIDEDKYSISYETGEIIFDEPLEESSGYNGDEQIYIEYSTDNVYNGFQPIDSEGYAPELDGDGHTISNIYINRPDEDMVGLFNEIEGGAIYDITIDRHISKGNEFTGILAGKLDGGFANDVTVAGSVEGSNYVGGLSGESSSNELDNIHSFVSISGNEYVGGLSGLTNQGVMISNASINTPTDEQITGDEYIGGITGESSNTDIITSYSTATITGNERVGGLVGLNREDSTIDQSYSASSINSDENVDTKGSLIGVNNGIITNSYWDTIETNQEEYMGEDSESEDDENIIGLDTMDMTGTSPLDEMSLFDFDMVWDVTEEYPQHIESTTLEYANLVENAPDISIFDAEDNDLIEIEDVVTEPPEYTNNMEDNQLDVNIIESHTEVYSFTLEERPSEEDEEDGETHNDYTYIPDTDAHLSEDSARLEGYRVYEDRNEIDVLYTAIDEDGNDIERDTEELIINIENDDLNPTVSVDGYTDTGSLTQFNLIPDDYVVEIEKEGYESKEIEITLEEERKVVNAELTELSTSELNVDVSRNANIMLDDEEREGTEAQFDELTEGEYRLSITPDDLGITTHETIQITDENKFIARNYESPRLTIQLENTDGESVEGDILLHEDERKGTSETIFGDLESNEYTIEANADGYEHTVESVEMNDDEDKTYVIELDTDDTDDTDDTEDTDDTDDTEDTDDTDDTDDTEDT